MKILIIKPSSLGDIVHGLQVVNEIKQQINDVEIDWIVRDCFADIVKLSGIADKIFLFCRRGGVLKFCKLIKEIRQYRYDYVLDMQGLARSGIMTLFAHSDKKIGRKDSREFSFLCYNKRVSMPELGKSHAMDILLRFLLEFNIAPELKHNLNFNIDCDKLSPQIVNLAKNNYISIFPYSRRKEKEWLYFSDLVRKLSGQFHDKKFVILGDRSLGCVFENVVDLTAQTSIADMIYLIQHSQLVIANDSAPMHIASAIGKNVLCLFGPTDPTEYGPYNSKKSRVLHAKNNTLSILSIDDVFENVVEMIK